MPPKKYKQSYRKLPKPKHAEEYSLEECASFQPWKVIIKVELDEYDPELVDYIVFVRAPNPHGAMQTAWDAFTIWEHVDVNNYTFFPRPRSAEMEAISEQQYKEEWKKAQRFTHRKGGMPNNPSLFRYWEPGWDKRSGLLRGLGNNIIVPDTAAIKAVEKQKLELDKKLKK